MTVYQSHYATVAYPQFPLFSPSPSPCYGLYHSVAAQDEQLLWPWRSHINLVTAPHLAPVHCRLVAVRDGAVVYQLDGQL